MPLRPSINQRFEKALDHEDLMHEFHELEEFFIERCNVFITEEIDFSSSYSKPLSFHIENCTDFGAHASIKGGVDTVVNRGTLTFLLWSAMAVAKAELIQIRGTEGRPPCARRVEGRNTISIRDFDLPDDPVRRALGFEIAFLCFVFIVMHELAHLAQGHCELMKGGFFDYGAPGGGIPDGDENDGLQRAFEMLADEFATLQLVGRISWMRKTEFPGAQPSSPPPGLTTQGKAWWFIYVDPVFSSRIPQVVLSIVFSLTSSTSSRHPTADRRLLASFRICFLLLMEMKFATEEHLKYATLMMEIVEDILLAAGPSSSNGWEGIAALSAGKLDMVEVELRQFNNHRKALENLLGKYVRLPKVFLQFRTKSVIAG